MKDAARHYLPAPTLACSQQTQALRRKIEDELDSVELGCHPELADAAASLEAPEEQEGARVGCCGSSGGYPNPLMHQVVIVASYIRTHSLE